MSFWKTTFVWHFCIYFYLFISKNMALFYHQLFPERGNVCLTKFILKILKDSVPPLLPLPVNHTPDLGKHLLPPTNCVSNF